MYTDTALPLALLSVFNFATGKAWLSLERQKTECFYHMWIKFYCKGCPKKLHQFKKCARTVKHALLEKISSFLSISGMGRYISKI
jgi:hypothetical protein